MAQPHSQQPSGNEGMSANKLVKDLGTEYAKGAAKEQGKDATEYYNSDEGQQHVEDAKAQAQGLWAKYCGCLGSA